MSEKLVSQRQELRGVGVSSGIGFGHARVMQTSSLQVPRYSVTAEDVDKEIGRLRKSVSSVSRELDQMIRRSPKKAPKEVKTFLEVFKLLVNDSTMFDDVSDRIQTQQINVEWALQKHLEDMLKLFDSLTDAYLAERSDDIVHVIRRLQEELTGERRKIQEKVRNAQSEVILVTNDLSIADVIWLTEYEELDLVGIVTEKGGPTSHTALLSQTLFIPAVVGVAGALSVIKNNDRIFVDSNSGQIICNPTASEIKEIERNVKAQEKKYSQLYRARRRVAETKDKFRVTLKANVAMVSGLDEILHLGAQGVGFFRSEYLFMGRDNLPEEREQMESYRELIDTMAGRPVTIRTIDVGGDKLLSAEARKRNYFSSAEKEDNPALGLRAIRFTLANPNLFITQIRAILRAASGADVRIMLPMISSLQEIREAKRYIELAKTQLREEKLEFNEFVPVGIMIELPAAVICAEELLAEADFASLGTNDLIQYTLGVDRGNPSVAPLYDECHPAVLRLIRAAVKAAQKQNKLISICGEMGGRREMVPFFLGLGINELSMVPMQIPIVKEMIRSLKRSSCQRLTLKLVKSRDSGEVRKLLEQFTEKGVEENVG